MISNSRDIASFFPFFIALLGNDYIDILNLRKITRIRLSLLHEFAVVRNKASE